MGITGRLLKSEDIKAGPAFGIGKKKITRRRPGDGVHLEEPTGGGDSARFINERCL